MATQEQISECKKLNVTILNNQDILTSNANHSPQYIANVRTNLNNYKQTFKTKDCDKVLILSKLQSVDKIVTKYSEIDKIRIETDSFKQRNKKIILGAVILVAGLLIVATISRK